MAIFRNEPDEWQRLDWRILQNGWVSLYNRPEFLLLDVSWFRKERYRVFEFDCSKWKDANAMHADLKLKFRFGEQYGENLNALKDSLSDISIVGSGLVVVLHQLDKVEKELAQSLLHIMAESGRFHMLLGERLITLAQVDDQDINYSPVGATPVSWNPHEWVKT